MGVAAIVIMPLRVPFPVSFIGTLPSQTNGGMGRITARRTFLLKHVWKLLLMWFKKTYHHTWIKERLLKILLKVIHMWKDFRIDVGSLINTLNLKSLSLNYNPLKQGEKKPKPPYLKSSKQAVVCYFMYFSYQLMSLDFPSDFVFYAVKQLPASDLKEQLYFIVFLTHSHSFHLCDYRESDCVWFF